MYCQLLKDKLNEWLKLKMKKQLSFENLVNIRANTKVNATVS